MLNQCNFIGRLGQDPESKFTAGGTQVVNVSIAVSQKYKGEEQTEWVRLVIFGKTAEFVQNYLTKGNLIFVSGRLQTRSWEDQNGQKKFTTEIIANTVQNLTPKADVGSQGGFQEPPTPPEPFGGNTGDDSDIPF